MWIGVMGPLRVESGAASISITAAKERSLLKTLALSVGGIVSTDVLIESLWGTEPPRAARKTLQTYVWNLRQLLGDDVIETRPPGYYLALDPAAVDVTEFRRLVTTGEVALRAGDIEDARSALGRATAMWRGDPLADVSAHTGLSSQGTRLHEEYLSALEARVAADLAAGAHDDIAGELEALVQLHPYRERLWGHLMVAHYRAGRQADALDTYGRIRRLLADELGLQPGGELRRLELAVLNQDPSLDAPVLAPTALVEDIAPSPIQYATCSDGVAIAYQTAGVGDTDLLVIPGFVHHLDIWWNAPTDRLVRSLASIGRLIMLDKRGMGLSDRPEEITADDWVTDSLAVLDAADARDVVVLGVSSGAPTALQLAHRHPERVRGLAIYGGSARSTRAPDYPIGSDAAQIDDFVEYLIDGWGTGNALEAFAPPHAEDHSVQAYWARYQQLSASPPAARRFLRAAIDTDVRELVPEIDIPTVVIHPTRDRIVPVEKGRWLADHLPDARFVPLDSDIHMMCLSDAIDVITAAIADHIHQLTASQRS